MSKQIANSLFIDSSLPRFYQQLLSGIGSYQELGNRTIRHIKAAHAFRQVERVRELSQLLINYPIKEYQLIAQYYLAWCQCRELRYDENILDEVIDQSRTYKTKALISRAAFDFYKNNFGDALFFYLESFKTNPAVSDYLSAAKAIAVIKSTEGFRSSALKDMERSLPFIRYAEPIVYYDFLNSYAVELGKASRKDEARNIIKHVVASPFAFAYPEWQETAQELKEPNHAFISVPHVERKPVQIQSAVTRHASKEVKPSPPDRVVYFPLREAPEPKRPEAINRQELEGMTLADKKEYILMAVRTELLQESDYDRFIYLLGLINIGPASDILDLEDKALLQRMIEVWCDAIDPEELAGVMSALRDCKDDQRREEIMDDIVSFAYRHTSDSKESESEWRRKVERRLPEK
jgi:hypothetical protein